MEASAEMVEGEPVYVAQTDEIGEALDAMTWWQLRAKEAFETHGATFFRYSVWSESMPNLILIEGWVERPDDQGELRWAVKRADGAPA